MKRTPLRRKTPLKPSGPLRRSAAPSRGSPTCSSAKSWRRPDEDKPTAGTIAAVLKRDGPCVAPRIDPKEAGRCWGRTTYDHIKPDPRMGVRAKSVPAELAAVCQGHSEDGMKAGRQWNTANRPEIRDWIRRHPV